MEKLNPSILLYNLVENCLSSIRRWLEQGPFGDVTEQRICGHARAVRKN